MRVLVHDHSGHAFQVGLSRELARRGHLVRHAHCSTFVSPKGELEHVEDDPGTFSLESLAHGTEFQKYSLHRRVVQELTYGRRFVASAEAFGPDVLVVCNTPLFSQGVLTRWAVRRGVGCVVWLQDLYSVAAGETLRRRAPVLGGLAGGFLDRVEGNALRRAHMVVAISEDFFPALRRWGVPAGRIEVVSNWAPIDELPVRPKDNRWAQAHGVADQFVFLYTGTLGLKHDPGLLVALAEHWRGDPQVLVVVISEGGGADWLVAEAATRGLGNLRVLPFQLHADYPEVLGAGDVLVAVLEPAAGSYSVPSKVLSYLCAERPILAVMPPENQAARTVRDSGAGVVVPAGDVEAMLGASEQLRPAPELREQHARRARAYAEQAFDLGGIADRFETIIERACPRSPDPP